MKVGLYVPCYNGAAWLDECLRSLLAQTRPADTVAVVDDGSTDRSAEIARSFGDRVRLIPHERNRGLAVARNTALSHIECDVLASVDADVRATPTWLAELVAGFDSPRTAAVGGMLIEAHQERLPDRWRAVHMAQHAGDLPLRNPPVLPGANVAVRRNVVRALGGYDESFRTNYEDADLQHRLIERGYHCRYEPAAQAHHLRTDTASSVLRTYWGWLRPPHERMGHFLSPDGLATRTEAVAAHARRAVWADLSGGTPHLAYLSLLVALLFPLADAHHAALRAGERADEQGAERFLALGATWLAELPPVLAAYSSYLGSCFAADAASLAWWPSDRFAGARAAAAESPFGRAIDVVRSVPPAWWPLIEQSRARMADEEGWVDASYERVWASRSEARRASGDIPVDRLVDEARRWKPDAIAVIVHGPAARLGGPADAPLDVLVATQEHHGDGLQETGGTRYRCLAAHRIGWLPPSPFQQTLLQTGRLIWGEPAALAAVPPWRPEQIHPSRSLPELRRAEEALARGRPGHARLLAAGALLVARRAYTPHVQETLAALACYWPEAQLAGCQDAGASIAEARRLLNDWHFEWDARRMRPPARARAAAMLEAVG